MFDSSRRLSVLGFCIVVLSVACGDDDDPNRPPEDAGMPEPDAQVEQDAAVSDACCADESCTEVIADRCAASETCVLDTSGKNGQCASGCPETQVCGELCCPWGAQCDQGVCKLADLAVEIDPTSWPYPSPQAVNESSCLTQDACVPAVGRYTLLETGVRVKNVGKVPFFLPDPTLHGGMDVSFCQGSYLLRELVHARVTNQAGAVVRELDLPTLCKREGNDYVCGVSGLAPGAQVDLPNGVCNQLDVTGLERGTYRVELKVNFDRAVAETNFENNSASYTFEHTGCDGFLCDGTCCPADVLCVDGACVKPNLTVRADILRGSAFFTERAVAGDVCVGEDRCVRETGDRRLLAFETRLENVGAGELRIGPDHPLSVPGCGEQTLAKDLVRYRLLDRDDHVVLEGHQRELCLMQTMSAGDPGPAEPSAGPWEGAECGVLGPTDAIAYGNGLPCQWLDITDVAPGDYRLEVEVNPAGVISEERLDDNVARVDVTIAAQTACQTEVCGDDVDQDCDGLPDTYDDDCGGEPPPDPTGFEKTEGNTSCGAAHAVDEHLLLETELGGATVTEACSASGSSAFYALTVAENEIVYADAFDSDRETSLILHTDGCAASLDCSRDACGRASGQFARVLTPGRYVLEARSQAAATENVVRVRIERVKQGRAKLITRPGVFEGDTSESAREAVVSCIGWDPETGSDLTNALEGPHDVYVVAHCDTNLLASTCGTANFDSAGSMYGLDDEASYTCSANWDACQSDPRGFAISNSVEHGLDYLVVGAQADGQVGAYQLQLTF